LLYYFESDSIFDLVY